MFLPCLVLVSCATMISGRQQSVTIDSTPAASNVTVRCANGTEHQGLTPLTVSLRRNAGTCTVNFQKDGYLPQDVVLEQGVNRAYWLNFLTIPLVWCTIAGWNGAFFDEPDNQSRLVGTACLAAGVSVWVGDYRTGAVWAYEPKRVSVVLKPRE